MMNARPLPPENDGGVIVTCLALALIAGFLAGCALYF